MNENKNLLIVYHSRSGHTQAMAEAVIHGARHEAIDGVEVNVQNALEATAEHVLAADGIILGTPENFGYMSGAMKMFFENIYYACLEHTQGLPYGLFIGAGNDGAGALSSVTRIVIGLRWKLAAPTIIVTGESDETQLQACHDLGMTLGAGLESGIF
jgi:multimeric flavodoxin WrbA